MDFGVLLIGYDANAPSVLVLAMAHIAKGILGDKRVKIVRKHVQDKANIQITATGDSFNGAIPVAKCLARVLTDHSTVRMYGKNPVQAAQVDFFLEMVASLQNNPSNLTALCSHLETHLTPRYFLAGHELSLADLAVLEACQSNPNWAEEQKKSPQVARWASYCSAHPAWAAAHAEVADALSKLAALKETSKGGSYEIDLPGAAISKVVTRFPPEPSGYLHIGHIKVERERDKHTHPHPPEPSGYLHIGHIKAAMLNDYFAKRFQGKLIMRFDDTNPAAEKDEYVKAIYEDLATMGVKYHQVTHTSDSFDQILKYGEQMLKTGKAYVDDTPVEKMREERKAKKESVCRNQSVEENLRRWGEMLSGSPYGKKCVVRAKIHMNSEVGAMRDPTLFRCNDTPHHRTGTKYKVYPTYDFSCPIVDALEGVTHTLRSVEFRDRNPQFNWIIDALGLRKVHIWEYSKLNLKYTVLSKRKLRWFVEQGYVTGWDDPRFPTVRGILRRGLTVEALRQFIKLQGASTNTNLMEWDKLWACNRDVIEPTSARYSAISKAGAVPLLLSDVKAPYLKTVALHPKNPAMGDKQVAVGSTLLIEAEDAKNIKSGEEITLINLGNAIVDKVSDKKLDGKTNLQGSVKTTNLKLQWLCQDKTLIPLKLIEYDYLIRVEKLEEDMELTDPGVMTECSKFETEAWGEAALANLKKGDIVQLTRRGFYICDKPLTKSEPMELIFIPDGKQKAMSTLSSKVARRK
eukprot:g3449.t1